MSYKDKNSLQIDCKTSLNYRLCFDSMAGVFQVIGVGSFVCQSCAVAGLEKWVTFR